MKTIVFIAAKYCSILHRHVCVIKIQLSPMRQEVEIKNISFVEGNDIKISNIFFENLSFMSH